MGAHTDINIKHSSNSHNIHGMLLSFLANIENVHNDYSLGLSNRKVKPRDIYYLGSRSVDTYEKDILDRYDITFF